MDLEALSYACDMAARQLQVIGMLQEQKPLNVKLHVYNLISKKI